MQWHPRNEPFDVLCSLTFIENPNLQKRSYLNNKMKSIKKIKNGYYDWITNKIKQLRKNISPAEQMNAINPFGKIRKITKSIEKKFVIQNKNTCKRTSEKLKQKLLASNNCLKQYKERLKECHQNRDCVNSPDRFYNELRGTNILIEKNTNI